MPFAVPARIAAGIAVDFQFAAGTRRDVYRIAVRTFRYFTLAARFARGITAGFQRIAAVARCDACRIAARTRFLSTSSASARIRRSRISFRLIATDRRTGFRRTFAARIACGITALAKRTAGIARRDACRIAVGTIRLFTIAARFTAGITAGFQRITAVARCDTCRIAVGAGIRFTIAARTTAGITVGFQRIAIAARCNACRIAVGAGFGFAFTRVRIGFIAVVTSRTFVRRAFFAIVAELLFARHARAVVGIIAVFAIRADVASARLRTRFAVRRSADANRRRVKRTAQFASAVAVRDIARRASRTRLAFFAWHTFGIRFTRVFAIFTVRAIAVRFALGFYALAFFVDQIPVGAGALRIDFARRAVRFNRVGIDALHPRVTALFGDVFTADQSCFASHGNAFARSVGQLSFGAAALFVFAARDALGVFRFPVFATVAFGAVVIHGACVRFASVRRRDCSLRTVAIAARAGDAFAGV